MQIQNEFTCPLSSKPSVFALFYQQHIIMSRFCPKDLYTIFKFSIYPSRIFFFAPFSFSQGNEIKISTSWRIISTFILLTSTFLVLYLNISTFPDDIRNPFQLLGFGRKLLFSITVMIRLVDIVRKFQLMANIQNTLVKIDLLLPLSNGKRSYYFFTRLFVIIFLILVFICRFLNFAFWGRKTEMYWFKYGILTNITDLVLGISDVDVIGLIFLTGAYFEMFQLELEKLSGTNEKIFLYTLEIPQVRKK